MTRTLKTHTFRRAILAAAMLAALPLAAHEATAEMTPEQKAEMQAYMHAGTPGPEHEQLARATGTYDVVVKSWHAPGEPSVETGTATRRMILGNRVMVEDFESRAMGQPFVGIGMHGYDNVTGKHWSTWNDSMSTGLMVSEGTCDSEGACTFVGSWNHPVSKEKVTARMPARWTSPTTQVFEMFAPGPDGKEMKMMEIVYTKRQ